MAQVDSIEDTALIVDTRWLVVLLKELCSVSIIACARTFKTAHITHW